MDYSAFINQNPQVGQDQQSRQADEQRQRQERANAALSAMTALSSNQQRAPAPRSVGYSSDYSGGSEAVSEAPQAQAPEAYKGYLGVIKRVVAGIFSMGASEAFRDNGQGGGAANGAAKSTGSNAQSTVQAGNTAAAAASQNAKSFINQGQGM